MTAPPIPFTGSRERRSRDPLAMLSRQLDADCVRATQPLELAAILEAEGFSDATMQERYGVSSVFAGAQRLFELVPLRPAGPTAQSPVQALGWAELLRGGLYLLPALWVPLALNVGAPAGPFQGASLGLLSATLLGWGWTQGMSYAGYAALVGGRAPAARTLRRAGLLGTLLTGVVALTLSLTLGLDAHLIPVCALGVAVYLCAATTLLVLNEGRQLLLASLPAVLWAGGAWLSPDGLAATLGHGGALLVVGAGFPLLAAAGVTEPLMAQPASSRRRTSVWDAAPHALYGWLCAATLSLALLEPFARAGGTSGRLLIFSWTVMPLVLSMGPLEYTLRRTGLALQREAATGRSLPGIVRSARLVALRCAAPYLLGLGSVYALVGVLTSRPPSVPPAMLLAGHAVLGAALLLSSLLIHFGLLSRVLRVWFTSVAVQVLLSLTGLEAAPAYALSGALCALWLTALSWQALQDVRHLT